MTIIKINLKIIIQIGIGKLKKINNIFWKEVKSTTKIIKLKNKID